MQLHLKLKKIIIITTNFEIIKNIFYSQIFLKYDLIRQFLPSCEKFTTIMIIRVLHRIKIIYPII